MPAEVDLRSRSDLVFAASIEFFAESVKRAIIRAGYVSSVPGFSNNHLCCAVAIVAEVKATPSFASFTAAKN